MKSIVAAAFAAGLLASAASAQTYTTPPSAAPVAVVNSQARVDLLMNMRKLWEDHIAWTRVYIIDAVAGLPDTDFALQRLLQNQTDLGNAIKPYYGDAAGNQLTSLLRDHIMIAGDVVKAAKAGDMAQVTAQQQRWSANAGQLAAFLSAASPNWQRTVISDMLQKHLDFTTQEAVDRLHGDWAGDIRAYDANHAHMLMFSDMLSDGIARQFAPRFAAR